MRSFHRAFLVGGKVGLALLTGCSSGGNIANTALAGAFRYAYPAGGTPRSKIELGSAAWGTAVIAAQ